jgi:hypothetical protein
MDGSEDCLASGPTVLFSTFGEIPSVLVFIGALFVFFIVPRIPFFVLLYVRDKSPSGWYLKSLFNFAVESMINYTFERSFLRWGRNPHPLLPMSFNFDMEI